MDKSNLAILSATINQSIVDVADKFTAIVSAIRDEYLSSAQNYPWIVGFSGGKDNTKESTGKLIIYFG
jgi:hypothetical protein